MSSSRRLPAARSSMARAALAAGAVLTVVAPAQAFQPKIPISQCQPGGPVAARPCTCADMPKIDRLIATKEQDVETWKAIQARNPRCGAEANQWHAQTGKIDPITKADLESCPDFQPIPEPNVCSANSDCGSHGVCYATGGGAAEDVCHPSQGAAPTGPRACSPYFELGYWDNELGEPIVDPCLCKTMCLDIVEAVGAHETRHHWDYTWGMASALLQALSVYGQPAGQPVTHDPTISLGDGYEKLLAAQRVRSELNSLDAEIDHLREARDDFLNSPLGEDCSVSTITARARSPRPPPTALWARARLLLDRILNGASR